MQKSKENAGLYIILQRDHGAGQNDLAIVDCLLINKKKYDYMTFN